jgi:hypothetical protein
MAKNVSDKDFGFKKLNSELKKLEQKPFVKIGVQGKDASDDKTVRNYDGSISKLSGITVVEIANFHEFGLGVPERSFLRSTLDENRNKYTNIVKELRTEITKGVWDTKTALEILGQKIVSDVKQKIYDGIPPELAESTIQNKTVAGRTGETPLIDTGQLVQSITYTVEMKGE